MAWRGRFAKFIRVVEYLGKFPGLAPSGNAKDKQAEYILVPDQVMRETENLTDKLKPHKIYSHLKNKFDEVSCPDNKQTIYNKIHRVRSKEERKDGHSNNITDQILHLENMVPFVRAVFRTSGRPPSTVLYMGEQLTDIKKLCCTGQTYLGIDKTFVLFRMHVTVTC